MAERFHLAQFNIALLQAPLDDPRIADFVAALPEVNALADASPGFVWRLTSADSDDALALRPYGDDVIVNMSVWQGPDDLAAYTYRSRHLEFMRRRREWFRPAGAAQVVLWWVPAGHRPTVDEALERLEALRRDGAGPHAFTLREQYPAPEHSVGTLSA